MKHVVRTSRPNVTWVVTWVSKHPANSSSLPSPLPHTFKIQQACMKESRARTAPSQVTFTRICWVGEEDEDQRGSVAAPGPHSTQGPRPVQGPHPLLFPQHGTSVFQVPDTPHSGTQSNLGETQADIIA